MASNKAGTQSGLICSWMWGAVATAACLACVWVMALVRDGGREGTSGPRLVCHSVNLLPATITSDRLDQEQGLKIRQWLKSRMWTVPTHAFSIWTKHVTFLVCFFPLHLLVCSVVCLDWWPGIKPVLPFLAGSTMTSCPFFWLQRLLLSCVYACHRVLGCLLTSRSPSVPFVCVCVVLCSSVEPAVCVRCTWLTCSRRAGCQQKPHHFTSPLSDSHPCQEDCLSGLKTHTECTAGSSVTEVCVFCAYERPFVPSL